MENTKIESAERQTALIDWLRFTCLWQADFVHPDAFTKRLSELLMIDLSRVSPSERNSLGNLGYGETLTYDEDLLIGTHPQGNIRIDGARDQFIVEISGQSCRHFEARGGDWVSLLSFLDAHPVRFNRIDLALDDIDGSLDIAQLKEKIYKQQFTSSFRGVKENGKIGDEQFRLAMPSYDDLEEDLGNPYIRDTRQGYTCTFGSRAYPIMLNIYDKLMERASKGIVAGVRNWVRFEVSITKNKVNPAIKLLVIPSLKEGTFGKTVAGIMRGLIEFKEGTDYGRDSNNNIHRLSIWRQYKKFLGNAEKIKIPSNQAKTEESVQRSIRWASEYWAKALIKLFGSGNVSLPVIANAVADKIRDGALNWKVLAEIKNYMRSNGNKTMTTAEILENIQMYLDNFGGMIDVASVFEEQCQKSLGSMTDRDEFYWNLLVKDGSI